MNLEEMVAVYLAIRTEREKLEAEYKSKDKLLENDMAVLERHMLDLCNESNASSIRTKEGTVMRRLNERFTIADPSAFREFVMENQAPELFEGRIHQTNFKEFMSEHQGEGLPPGVNVMREFAIVVRRPS